MVIIYKNKKQKERGGDGFPPMVIKMKTTVKIVKANSTVWYRGNFDFYDGEHSTPLGDNMKEAKIEFFKRMVYLIEGEEDFGKVFEANLTKHVCEEGKTIAETETLIKIKL